MKIKKIKIENFKAVEQFDGNFEGCSVIVMGANNSGKTSVINGLIDRLRGECPEKIIKEGENNGYYVMELTDGSRFEWDLKKNVVTYVSKENITQKVTKTISEKFFPAKFDIDKFLNSSPAERFKQFKTALGVDLSDLESDYKEIFEQRAYQNKRVKELELKVQPVREDLPNEIPNVGELSRKLSDARANNDLLARNKQRLAELRAEIDELEDVLMEMDEIPTAEIEKEITNAQLISRAIMENNEAKKTAVELEKARETVTSCVTDLESNKAAQVERLQSAGMPQGFSLEFDENGKPSIRYEGYEIDRNQISLSKSYIVALKLAAHNLKAVKALHFDASALDRRSLNEVFEFANANDLQLLIERPDFESETDEIHYNFI